MDEIIKSIPEGLASVFGLRSPLSSADGNVPAVPRRKSPLKKGTRLSGNESAKRLNHSDHQHLCPPLPDEGIRATEDISGADIEAQAADAALKAHFDRWRQAVIDAEVLRRPETM